MGNSTTNYNYLIRKIDEFIRKYYLNKIVRGCIYMASALLFAYILVTLAEFYGNFNPVIRTILFYTFIIGNLAIVAWYIVWPLLAYFKLGKTINHEQASSIIGNHFNPVKDKLLNTLQLKKLSDENPGQRLLIEASIDQKIADLKPVPFTSAIRLGENKRFLKFALVPLGLIICIFFMAPSIFSESTNRLLNHNKAFVKKAPFQFVVLNKSLSAVQGEDYVLQVKLTGNEIPADIYLEDGVNSFKLEKENIIRFKYIFKNLQQTKQIRLTAGEFSSETYQIEVKAKPMLLNFNVSLEYPAYLKKANETLNNSGDLNVPEGTRITWKFKAENTNQINFKINNKVFYLQPESNQQFNFAFKASQNINYSVQPTNKFVNTADSVSYQVRVIPDLKPTIDVNEKTDSVNNKQLYFVGQVNDDHGFSKFTFNYRLLANGISKMVTKTIALDKNELQSNFFYVWNVNEVKANPGEQLEYYFEIFDNDGVNGAKSARSAVKTYKLLSEREVEKKLDENSESIKQKMEQAIKQASSLEKEAKRVNQDLLNKKNLSFDEKKQVEKLLEKQKDLEELIKDIQKENKQNQFEHQENAKQRDEILEKQKQIEELFNNVLDEKTKEILKNIQQLLDENNKNKTQDELSKMQVDNKSLQKELDRILELYKQLEFDQKLTETLDKLKELANKQEDLSEKSLQKNADADQLKQKQEELTKDFKSVQEDLKELEKKNEELDKKNDFQNPEKEQEQIEQQQEQSSKNLEKKDSKKASENQKKAASQMKQLSQKLENMQKENEEEENQVNAQSLREILDNLLTTSFDQEKVMQAFRNTNTNDPAYVLQTQKQKDIKDNLKMIEDSLYSLSKKVPQIQSVVNKEIQSINLNVKNSLENLAERRTAEANRNQQYTMTSINNLALMLSEALEQLQKSQQNSQSGGKGKKQKSLSQLSKMQDQLNNSMQKAREQMQKEGGQEQQKPGGKGKGAMSEQLAKMAREQQIIRQAMQDINKELNKDGKSGLGNLDKLMKQMEQTETDLVNKKIKQETINRQQDILTKLLEAEKADREREQDNKRESKKGVDTAPDYKVLLQDYQKIKQRETELLRTVPPALNSFYKIKVGDYFKFLNSDINK
ncbi:MAG: DUF4175 family protein [Daejeonella sp.]